MGGRTRAPLTDLSRREFIRSNAMAGGLVLTSCAIGGVLAACGDSDDSSGGSSGSEVTAQDVANASGTIKVYGWSSERAPAQNAAGNVKAKWTDIGGDAAQIPTKIRPEGSFDVFTSTASQMEQYFAIDRLAPIDTSLLKNYGNIDRSLRDDPVWKGPDGKVYAVPIILGLALIAWDSDKVAEPKSLDDLLKPEYENGIGLYDDYQMINTVAQGLGLPQPPEMTHDELEQVKAYLEKLRPQVKTFFTFGGEAQLFGRGDITVAYTTFAALIVGEQKSNPAIKTNYVSSVTYADAFSILKGDNEVESLAWIDQAISAPAMKDLAKIGQAPTAMPSANSVLPKELADLKLEEVSKRAPIVGPYPIESKANKVSVQEATNTWSDYKASFA